MVPQEETLMKKKQLISIIVMVVCVAVLAAGYILMKEYNLSLIHI